MPHMHLRGKSFQYEATFPDGRKQTLLSVPGLRLRLADLLQPGRAPGDAQGDPDRLPGPLRQLGGNPANPDPAKAVTWGEQTFEEMMIGYHRLRRRRADRREAAGREVGEARKGRRGNPAVSGFAVRSRPPRLEFRAGRGELRGDSRASEASGERELPVFLVQFQASEISQGIVSFPSSGLSPSMHECCHSSDLRL